MRLEAPFKEGRPSPCGLENGGVHGYGSTTFVVESWCCLFDVAARKIVLDKKLLEKANIKRVSRMLPG
jgi:hypothetical protein